MASRRFFGYDPYDYYYTTSPYHYHHPYYSLHKQPAPAPRAGSFFPVVADGDDDRYYYGYNPEPAVSRAAGGLFPSFGELDPYYRRAASSFPAAAKLESRSEAGAARPVSSIPVHFTSEPEPELEDTSVPVKRAPSAESAAVRLQSAARGFLARRAVRALRVVEREAEEIGAKVAREAEALRGDGRARVAVGEQLMRLLFRLDTVRGAREFRKRVAKRVLAMQDAVDALEQRRVEQEASGTSAVETVEEEVRAAEVEEDAEVEAAETAAEMEVDGDRVAAEDEEPAVVDSGADRPADENVSEGGEWEMVAEAEEPAFAVPAGPQSAVEPRQPAAEETTTRPAEAGSGDMDAKKLMEMVAVLCEQSAQQRAAIGALADRVDALERAVRRVEDAEGRRRRAKKLRKEGKGSNRVSKCYSD